MCVDGVGCGVLLFFIYEYLFLVLLCYLVFFICLINVDVELDGFVVLRFLYSFVGVVEIFCKFVWLVVEFVGEEIICGVEEDFWFLVKL